MNEHDLKYKETMKDILENGSIQHDRTGIGTITTFGKSFTIDLQNGFPCLTLRKVAFRIAFEETMFFLRGETDTKKLEEKKINIWKGNTTRKFLDNRGLTHLPVGDMGKGYGYQWRNFNGVDQIAELLKALKENPTSRRHILTAWNPSQLHEMALPPCHIMNQYQVVNGCLNSLFFLRSNDFLYGYPYNVMCYAFLNHLFAKYLGLKMGHLTYMAGDCHLYSNQIDMAAQLITREPLPSPILFIDKHLETLDDLLSLEFKDVQLARYSPLPDFTDKPPMAV